MNNRFRIFFYYGYKVGLHVFALIGLVLVGGFFAVRFHWTDVKGAIDTNSNRFGQVVLGKQVQAQSSTVAVQDNSDGAATISNLDAQINDLTAKKIAKAKNYCDIDVIGQYAPGSAAEIIQAYQQLNSDMLVSRMILAVRIRIEEKNGSSVFANCDNGNVQQIDDVALNKKYFGAQSATIFPWMNNEQWATIREAIVKDKDVVAKAAAVAGIEPRLLVSCAIVEQVRLFNTDREMYKKFFEPLKILGNANKISLGVMGVKEQTAIDIENHLKDPASPYYLGSEFEHALDYTSGAAADGDRYNRLTEDSHYYSYLYGALYLKQMMTQWEKAGYDIIYRPEIVGTLFNVGFPQSNPNPQPKVGGSEIAVDGTKYTFGSLAYEFYYSGELMDAFPYFIN